MVEINLRDDGDFRQQNVGRVQAPAHAGFAHGELRARAGEIHEGDRRHALEKSGMRGEASGGEQFLDRFADARERGGKFRVGNFLAVQANAFVDALQMRRSVQAGAQARRAQNRIEHRRRGAFAVRARDVHGLKRALRLPQVFAKHGDIFQIEFRGARLPRRGEFASQAEEVLDRFFVGHAVTPGKNRARRKCRPSGPCDGRRRREIRAPAEIPTSEIPWEVSGGWSARSRAARRSRSARRARRY